MQDIINTCINETSTKPPCSAPITTTAPGVKLSRTPMTVGRVAARPGSDAASVLAEIDMGGELERLIREGVIAVDGVKAGS